MTDLQSRLEEAKQLESEGKYNDADSLFSKLIELAEKHQDPILPALFNFRGIDRRMLRRYDESFADYESALDSNPNSEQTAFAWINKADIYRVRDSDFASAHKCIDEAIIFSEDKTLMRAKSLYQRALIFFAEKKYEDNIESHEGAIEILEELVKTEDTKDVKKSLGQNLQGAASGYIWLNNPDKVSSAYDYSIRALDLFEGLGDQQGIFNSVVTLGRILEITKNYDEAITQYKRGWEVLEKTGYGRSITVLSLHLAGVYLEKGQSDKSIPYLERFAEGIVNGEITDHDKDIIGGIYKRVNELYAQKGLSVESFEGLKF